jgi:hypothetical protein
MDDNGKLFLLLIPGDQTAACLCHGNQVVAFRACGYAGSIRRSHTAKFALGLGAGSRPLSSTPAARLGRQLQEHFEKLAACSPEDALDIARSLALLLEDWSNIKEAVPSFILHGLTECAGTSGTDPLFIGFQCCACHTAPAACK